MAYTPSQNPYAEWTAGSDRGSPSIVGALPYTNASSYPICPVDLVSFTFTALNPTILNCTVLGPDNRVRFSVTTDTAMEGYTVFKDTESRSIALVEWQHTPLLEARGLLQKQQINNWLRLASDRSYRAVEIRGTRYTWAPQDQYICLWNAASESSGRRCLARISKTYNIVSLELAPEAIQLGLLEACVITTVLLQCGRNID
ncbi:hypothetical protein FIBSPDRAFT_907676 [Athelia psychrophila]|uniref:DUF6593 domain-containing protein n=1 Tax=Athelia psychrophila TaxID=1759441 RepID=A0A166UAQ6_9AGAM|nr:hypothetical protein FIBSPDRAFT_907676 [Fibularhizoctonia sp. CBS 109695]